jgi:hypothetical protein
MKYFQEQTNGKIKIEWETCARSGVPTETIVNLSAFLERLSDEDIARLTDGVQVVDKPYVSPVEIRAGGSHVLAVRMCRMENKPEIVSRLKQYGFTSII